MALTWFNRWEGTTLDATHDFTVGTDTTAASFGAPGPAINATAALVGSNGLQVTAGGNQYRFDAEAAVLSVTEGSVLFWFRIQNLLDGMGLIELRGASFDDAINISVVEDTGPVWNLMFRYSSQTGPAAVTLPMVGNHIAINTTYICDFSWNQPANDRRIRLYNAAGTLLETAQDLATAYTVAVNFVFGDGMRFGETAGAAVGFYEDNIFIGKEWNDADTFYTKRAITSYTEYNAVGGDVVRSFPAMRVPNLMM